MSQLQQIPPRRRQRMAAMLAPLALVLLLAGVLPLAMGANVAVSVLAGVVLLAAVILLLVSAGLARSARLDLREAELDAAIMAASPGCGGDCGSCGEVDDCAVKSLPRL